MRVPSLKSEDFSRCSIEMHLKNATKQRAPRLFKPLLGDSASDETSDEER